MPLIPGGTLPGISAYTDSRRKRLVLALTLVAALAVAFLVKAAARDDDGYRYVHLAERPGTGISLNVLWQDMARAAEYDPRTISLESMRLEYAGSGRLQSGTIEAFSPEGAHLQLHLSGKAAPDTDPLVGGVGISAPSPPVPGRTLVPGEPFFRAIDLAGPSHMITLMQPAGYGGYYTFLSAYSLTTPLQPISPSATAYLWQDGGFAELAADDERREFSLGYQYVAAFTAKLVSTSSDDNTIAKAHEGSGAPVYFLIPTPPT